MVAVRRSLGTPCEDVWPGVKNLKGYRDQFPKWPSPSASGETVLQRIPSMQQRGGGVDTQARDLLHVGFGFVWHTCKIQMLLLAENVAV